MAVCTAKDAPNMPKSESITDGWTDGPTDCHTLLSYLGVTNNESFNYYVLQFYSMQLKT